MYNILGDKMLVFFQDSDLRICFFFTTDTNMSIVILRQNSVSKNRVFCLKLCKNIYETFKLVSCKIENPGYLEDILGLSEGVACGWVELAADRRRASY